MDTMEQQSPPRSADRSPVAIASSEAEQEHFERMDVSDSKPETSPDREEAKEAADKCNSPPAPSPPSPPPSPPSPPSSPPSPPSSPPSSPVTKKEPISVSTTTHPLTMPAFMSVLNLQPTVEEKKGASNEYKEEMDVSTLKSATLLGRYQEDPGSVLELLKSCLSVDKLATLVKAEYRSDTEKLASLQAQLEEAYETLKSCNEKKEGLNIMVTETNERIRTKRKQLEDIREELRELGEEELKLKRRRDETASKCLGIKRKLQASREAIQQISELTAKKSDGAASLAGTSTAP